VSDAPVESAKLAHQAVDEPVLGQHSTEVLESWLGLSGREIEGLAADKIITQRT